MGGDLCGNGSSPIQIMSSYALPKVRLHMGLRGALALLVPLHTLPCPYSAALAPCSPLPFFQQLAQGSVPLLPLWPPCSAASMRFNDGKVSPQGSLLVGRMHSKWRDGNPGRLYRLDPGSRCRKLFREKKQLFGEMEGAVGFVGAAVCCVSKGAALLARLGSYGMGRLQEVTGGQRARAQGAGCAHAA